MTRRRGPPPFVVLTDVDGCLLDARTYRPGPARAALAALRRRGVPVFVVSSKTRAELALLDRAIGPFAGGVVESGGGLWIGRVGRAEVVHLGPSYGMVRAAFVDWRTRTGRRAVGFGDLAAAAIARSIGLPLVQARAAKAREFDEPIVLDRRRAASDERSLRRYARARRLRVTRGGGFHHLHGGSDKGTAARALLRRLPAEWRRLPIVAFGDSPHDAPLLRLADLAVIVPRLDGRAGASLARAVPRAVRAPAPGPAGWTAVIERLLAPRD